MIFTVSNFLSLLRAPLALLFIFDHVFPRTLAIVLAMITDSLDGYLARRYDKTSQLGAFLDPLMDKFFVFFVGTILIIEERLTLWEFLAFISRDFAVVFFGFLLVFQGSRFQFRSIWSGKIATTLQFFVLLNLVFDIAVPSYMFWCLIGLGITAFFELYLTERQIAV